MTRPLHILTAALAVTGAACLACCAWVTRGDAHLYDFEGNDW